MLSFAFLRCFLFDFESLIVLNFPYFSPLVQQKLQIAKIFLHTSCLWPIHLCIQLWWGGFPAGPAGPTAPHALWDLMVLELVLSSCVTFVEET